VQESHRASPNCLESQRFGVLPVTSV